MKAAIDAESLAMRWPAPAVMLPRPLRVTTANASPTAPRWSHAAATSVRISRIAAATGSSASRL